MKAYNSLQSVLEKFSGITDILIEEAVIDKEGEGVMPSTISITFFPSAIGFHALEFIVWALGDMRRAGASVHHYLESAPPWLNHPGYSLNFTVYVNPRSDEISDSEALDEVLNEIEEMAEFLRQVHMEYWPLCVPKL